MNSDAANQHILARFQLYHANTSSQPALDVDLDLPGRGVTAVFGPSGSGKTTLLRCLAGLEKPIVGQLAVNGQVWQDANTFVPTHRRSLGYVFQEASLFAHLNAAANLQYAVKRADTPVSQTVYQQAVDTMGIASLLNRYPAQLSGGERQRVAIARALLVQPQLLLMDEPLASLDAARKQEILPYLQRLCSTINIPVVYVSHVIEEINQLADTLVVLETGRAIAQGALTDLSARIDLPLNLGNQTGVVLPGTGAQRETRWQLVLVKFAGGALWVRDNDYTLDQPVRLNVLARDISLALTNHSDSSLLNRLQTRVVAIADDNDPAMQLVSLACGESRLIARITRKSAHHLQLHTGQMVWAQVKAAALI